MFEEEDVSYNVTEAAASVVQDLLPTKSRERYEKAYQLVYDWCKVKQLKELTEDVLLAYFGEKAKIYKPSSLWSVFSMLKSTLLIKNNLNIGQFCRLIAFLKKKNLGFQPKKSNVFSRSDVDKFLLESPEKEFLLMKEHVAVMSNKLSIANRIQHQEMSQTNEVSDNFSATSNNNEDLASASCSSKNFLENYPTFHKYF